MTALVRGVTAPATASGVTFSEVGSESTSTTSPPTYATAFADATYVIEGTMTSSPGPMPSATSARCSAAVPLLHVIACSTPAHSAKASSNRFTYGPCDDTHSVVMQSVTYFISFP